MPNLLDSASAVSLEQAQEIFAVLTHALIGAGLPDNTRDKLAAREHDFLTGDLSHRALQARGMRLSTPDFIGIQAQNRTDSFEGEYRPEAPAGEPLLHFPVEQPTVEFLRTVIPLEGMHGVLQDRRCQPSLRMSHGAMNCPFFTFTARPVLAAATSKSVCRAKKGGLS
jgi:hypothetical protein